MTTSEGADMTTIAIIVLFAIVIYLAYSGYQLMQSIKFLMDIIKSLESRITFLEVDYINRQGDGR